MKIPQLPWIPSLLPLSLALAVAACDDAPAAGDDLPEPEPEPELRDSVRGMRTCELFEPIVQDDHLGMDVWNNGDLHDCPDEYLAAVDPGRFGVGGPRWRSVDEQETVDEEGQPVRFDPEISEVPAGLGYDMFLAAQVLLTPLAELEQTLGITVDDVEDLPPQVFQNILDATVANENYQIVEVQRALTTRMVHHAGNEVFVIDDGQCRYAMKYYTNVIDAELTDEDAIARLGEKFQSLPEGWSFQVLTFEDDLVVEELDGTAYVIADEFGNSYDRYECD